MKPINYYMENTVNGQMIELIGGGTIDKDGTMSIEVKVSKTPKGWNAILAPCICSGPGGGTGGGGEKVAGGLFKYAHHGYMTTPGKLRKALLADEVGNILAVVNATGTYAVIDNGLDFKIKVDTIINENSIIPTLTKIDHYSFTIEPLNNYQVKVYSHYSLSNPNNQ